jgi:AraC-like DNA-binding protein
VHRPVARLERVREPLDTRGRHIRALLLRRISLKEIAAATGFTDVFHLSRVFKQAEGVSPRKYLRRVSGAR